MFVFIKGTDGTSKNTGKDYQVLTLAQHVEVGGKVKIKIADFFPEKKINLSDFDFGDIVSCEFRAPEFYGDYPKLVSVEVQYGSPYTELVKKYNQRNGDE